MNDGSYRRTRLLALAYLVAFNEDVRALEEIHSRRVIPCDGRPPMRLAEFFESLRQSAARRGEPEIGDLVAQALADRWARYPPHFRHHPPDSGGESAVPAREADCRNTYAAYVRIVEAEFAATPPRTGAELETREAGIMHRLVLHHLVYCRRDARRGVNLLTSKYTWRRNGTRVTLRFPRHVSGKARREWLEEHAGSCGPGDAAGIQALIDTHFGTPAFVPLTDTLAGAAAFPGPGFPDEDGEPCARRVIADEKVAARDAQPVSFARLSPGDQHRLVMTVLENVVTGELTDREVADRFGLSASTYSRIAGSRWPRDGKGGLRVPWLYANVARVLAEIPWLREAAERLDVWETACACSRGEDPRSTRAQEA